MDFQKTKDPLVANFVKQLRSRRYRQSVCRCVSTVVNNYRICLPLLLRVPIFQQLHQSFEQADRKFELSSSRFLSLNSNSSGADNQIINQGENLYNISYGAKYQTVQIRKHPLTIIFLATSSASTGLILKESKELDTYFCQLQTNARTHLQIQN
ncbi:unnamed protein product [Oikopleura dioica]|uniref:Uncharacterized protein n=1 Tax=Oikopleura dioica TaxID=34765 RepID=E4XB55_OIKDI|nr:unnamed protein product [Oikopleura dioica]